MCQLGLSDKHLRHICVRINWDNVISFIFLTEEVHSCLWQDCGFCSVECDGEMLRHMLFHCYHSKLKQWGSAMLKAHPDMGDCSVGLQNRNIVPEVQETFLCLWEHCEVKEREKKRRRKHHPYYIWSMRGMSENFATFHWTWKKEVCFMTAL